VITAVDGKAVQVSSQVGVDIQAIGAGKPITFTVRRKTGTTTVSVAAVPCGTACPGDAQRPIVGVAVETDNQSFSFPKNVDLSITTQGIGGPSAGLAFTLGAIDALTTHDLTGGHAVAVTGAILPDGTVQDVGGVTQKTITVYRQGARYFIVPADETAVARKAATGHHLTIVPVTTLEQALAFLRTIGGNLSGVPALPANSTL
jgi:Lon-like protease